MAECHVACRAGHCELQYIQYTIVVLMTVTPDNPCIAASELTKEQQRHTDSQATIDMEVAGVDSQAPEHVELASKQGSRPLPNHQYGADKNVSPCRRYTAGAVKP
jgi:hypothetical protein